MNISKEDLKELVSLLDHLLEMARRASRLGLAALEKERNENPDRFIRKGLELLLRGTDSVNIERIYKNLQLADSYSNKGILHLRMVMEAMISLCRRDSFEDMEMILFSVLGDRGREEYIQEKALHRQNKVREFLEGKVPALKKMSPAGEKLMSFNKKQIDILLEQVNPELLAPFLAGESHLLQSKILGFLDEDTQSDIVDQLELGFLDLSIEKAQKLVSYRIRRIGGEFKDEEVLSQKEVDALLHQKSNTVRT